MIIMEYNEKFMREALKQAKKAASAGETPIGAVIVRDGRIIARAYNKREIKKNALCHAEILAINKACRKLGGWRLIGCDLYVTLEPCAMCAGACNQARLENVYFAAYDAKAGCAGSVTDMFEQGLFPHTAAVSGGHMAEEASKLMRDFFCGLREKKRLLKEQASTEKT